MHNKYSHDNAYWLFVWPFIWSSKQKFASLLWVTYLGVCCLFCLPRQARPSWGLSRSEMLIVTSCLIAICRISRRWRIESSSPRTDHPTESQKKCWDSRCRRGYVVIFPLFQSKFSWSRKSALDWSTRKMCLGCQWRRQSARKRPSEPTKSHVCFLLVVRAEDVLNSHFGSKRAGPKTNFLSLYWDFR